MRYVKTAATALIVGLVLLMATDYVAMAATGRPFLLGKVNKVGKPTTIKSAKGPALKINTKAGQPPLQVNRKGRVANFNADLLDGRSANELGVRTSVYAARVSATNTFSFQVQTPEVAAGSYLITLSGFLTLPANEKAECTVGSESSTDYFIDQWIPANPDGKVGLNAAGLATLSSSQPIFLECFSEGIGTLESFGSAPIRISLTAIDARTNAALSVVPVT